MNRILFCFGLSIALTTLGHGQEEIQRLHGVCFSSVRDNESPARQIHALPSAVEQDVATASRLARAIRTYTVQSTSYLIPEFCQTHGIDCIVGAWIGPDRWQNDAQLERLIHLASGDNSRIKSVIIGNEVLHRGDCNEAQLIEYVRLAKAEIDLPIAVADTWRAWVEHPKLAAEVDICGVQIYPYWEGLSIDGAAEYTLRRLRDVQALYPDKRIVLTEFGWPTDGDTLGQAEATPQNAARYFREVIPLLDESGIEYYYFALWNEKWKVGPEGGVGAHWGLFHSDGSIKPALKDLLPAEVRSGSKRPPRSITFQLPADQTRNAEVRMAAIGNENADSNSLETTQRGVGLENSFERAGQSPYGGLRPLRMIEDQGAEDAQDESKQDDKQQPKEHHDASKHPSNEVTFVSIFPDQVDSACGSTDDGGSESGLDEVGTGPTEVQLQVNRLHGVCLGLFRDNESPHFGITPLISEIRADLDYASGLADAVRTYSVADSFAFVPQISAEIGVDCYPGAALGKYPWLNDLELEMLIRLGRHPNSRVKALIVGNEVMHRGDFSVEQYVQYIRSVKREVEVPVAIAELLHSWIEHPELAAEVDILGVQIYPYWGGLAIDAAAADTVESVQRLKRRYPGKTVILTEFGWPTAGGKIGAAVASPENAARYFREVIPALKENGIEYLYFAMTDEKWKQQDEGGPGAHWGLLRSDGTVKACFRDALPEKASKGMRRPARKLSFDD